VAPGRRGPQGPRPLRADVVVPDESGITPGYEHLQIDDELLKGDMVPMAPAPHPLHAYTRQMHRVGVDLPRLARVLGEAAVGTSKTNTFLGERYRRIARRRGKKKAVVAVGRPILVIVWYLLLDDAVHFHDLGLGYYDSRINPERKKRNHIRELEALGYRVTLQPAA
jgi:hypothetical protein